MDIFNEKSTVNGRTCGFCEISFKRSINQLLEYHELAKIIAAMLLTNFTFVLQRISEWKFLMIFNYTELLPRHSESDRTLISSRTSRSERLEKFFLKIIRTRQRRRQYSRRQRSSFRSKQYFTKKMSLMKFVLFSVTLKALYASSVVSNFISMYALSNLLSVL